LDAFRHDPIGANGKAKKWIGSFAAAVRKRICDGLGFLGIELDHKRNARSAALISLQPGRVKVRVISTDEELMIARFVTRVLDLGSCRDSQN
jgi:acetate kinase